MSAGTPIPDSERPPGWATSTRRLRYLAGFVRPHRVRFWLSIAGGVATTASALVFTFFAKRAIDRGIDPVNGGVDMSQVALWVSLALVAALIAWAAATLQTYVTGTLGVRVLNDLRVALFRHIQSQSLDFFHRERTGRVISRLTNDIDALEQLVTDGVYVVFNGVVTLIGIEILLFAINPRLALATNIVFPVMLAATVLFRYFSTRAYRRTRERMALVTAHLQESISGMRIVQAFAAEERVADEFYATTESYRRANMDTIYLSAVYFPGVELLSGIGTAIVLWYGGLLRFEEALTFGVIFAFIAYLNDFFDPIQQLSQFYNSFLSAMAALDKIMEVMETVPSVQDAPDAQPLDDVRGEVSFEGVSFAYEDGGTEVLRDIDLHVKAGETVAIVGHTGAGKSTMVKLLARFYDPQKGTVRIDGRDLRQIELHSLRSRMGVVPQEGFLFSKTVAENVAFGRPEASRADVEDAVKAAGAHEFVTALPDGYDTRLGERGANLSAGQRQLLAFARALLAEPSLLVLDEATSGVDLETEQHIEAALQRLVSHRTAFIVAHRLSTIRRADRIVVIEHGQIVEQGTHDELLALGGTYSRLYGVWEARPQPTAG